MKFKLFFSIVLSDFNETTSIQNNITSLEQISSISEVYFTNLI